MGIGQSFATEANDEFAGERGLHVLGTRQRRKGTDYWMFNPPLREQGCLIVCGICKQPMSEERHCKNCYPEREETMGFLRIQVDDDTFLIPVEGEITPHWHVDEDMEEWNEMVDDEIKYAVEEGS